MDAMKEAADKANAVFGSIAGEAFERTGGDIYATDPPPDSPPVEEEAASEAAPPADQPAVESTSPQPSVFGKYRSLEEAERGYHEAVRMGNLAKAEADAARMRLDAIERTVGGGPTPQPAEDPLDQLESYGLPKELIARLIDARFEQSFDRKFAPAIKTAEADQKIVEKYPEYSTEFKAIKTFVESTPEVLAQVDELNKSGNYLAARQIAYLNWKLTAQQAAVAEAAKAAETRTTEVKDNRKDAGVGKPRRADTRTSPAETETSAEEMERLVKLHRAGHSTPLLRNMFDKMLPADFDKQTAQLG